MRSERTIEDLTSAQQEQLTALLAELGTFPTAETLVRCQEALNLDPDMEFDPAQADKAMAGAWAYDRMLLYLDRLRSLNEERMQLGNAIRELKQHPYPTTKAEVPKAAWAKVMAPHLAGRQEVVLNFFCVSVQHIRSLLKVVAEAVGYEIPPADLSYLDEFRHLRNHFEHWYDRLPGKTNEVGLMTKTMTTDEYRVRGGLRSDDKDRIIVIEPKKSGPVTHIVDVTNEGVARIEKIARETSAKVNELAIKHVRAYFIAHPENTPAPEDIRQDSLINVAKKEPELNPTKSQTEEGSE